MCQMHIWLNIDNYYSKVSQWSKILSSIDYNYGCSHTGSLAWAQHNPSPNKKRSIKTVTSAGWSKAGLNVSIWRFIHPKKVPEKEWSFLMD